MIKKKKLCGTARYASVHALECYEQSRRDDLESVSYVAVYLIKGELPWQGVKGKTKEERYAKILEMKRRMNEDDICSGIDGGDVKEFMKYVRGLGYEEEPQYEKWMNRFKEVLRRRFKWKEEYEYEWSRKDKKKKERMMLLTMRTREDKEESGNDYEDKDDKKKFNNVIQYKNNNVNVKYVHSGNDNRTKTYLSKYNSNNNHITITNENNIINNNKDGSYKVDRDKTDNKCCIIY